MGVEFKGVDRLMKKLNASEQNIRQNLLKALKTSTNVVQIAAKTTVSRSTGDLARSIATDIKARILTGIVGLDYPGKKYGKHVEFGTRPHWVSVKALERWAKKKGISPYAVQKSIARKGTKKHPFLIPAFTKNKEFIQQQFKGALKRITKEL